MTLLHTHEGAGNSFGEIMHGLWHEVILHGLLDTLKILLFLFLAYLFMEFLEHKASGKLESSIKRAGAAGPAIGGLAGAVPQCGFSSVASNFYAARVVSMGTVVAVFLSTSDEMLPVMLAGKIKPLSILAILGYKIAVGITVGFLTDLALHLAKRKKEEINIDEICENDNCHCERGILYSALHHTLTVGLFVLLITIGINTLIFFIGEDKLALIMYDKPFISHLIASLVGLIPNCAVSVALTSLAMDGLITAGTMMSGLFSGAGVGLLVLFKVNKKMRENFIIIAILVGSGLVFGMLADLIGFSSLI